MIGNSNIEKLIEPFIPKVKNGRDLLDHGTLKSAVSQESELIK